MVLGGAFYSERKLECPILCRRANQLPQASRHVRHGQPSASASAASGCSSSLMLRYRLRSLTQRLPLRRAGFFRKRLTCPCASPPPPASPPRLESGDYLQLCNNGAIMRVLII